MKAPVNINIHSRYRKTTFIGTMNTKRTREYIVLPARSDRPANSYRRLVYVHIHTFANKHNLNNQGLDITATITEVAGFTPGVDLAAVINMGTNDGPSASEPIKERDKDIMKNKEAKIERVAMVLPRSGTTTLFLRGGSPPTTVLLPCSLAPRLRKGEFVSPIRTCGPLSAGR